MVKDLYTIFIIVIKMTWMHPNTSEILQVLHKAMQGLGTDDTTLIRVIVTRTEIDMQYIKAEYLRKYNKTLYDAVHSETSDHYRTFLLSLLGPNLMQRRRVEAESITHKYCNSSTKPKFYKNTLG